MSRYQGDKPTESDMYRTCLLVITCVVVAIGVASGLVAVFGA